jgi:ComF family protein
VREWADALLAILLSPLCAVCHRPLAEPTRGCVCEECWRGVSAFEPPTCERCGDPVAMVPVPHDAVCPQRSGASAIDLARAIGPHAGPLRAIVHALKYDARRSVASRLARLMHDAARDLLADADVAIPVPLHHFRRLERGFNQADDLARALGLPVSRAIRRVRQTESQANLGAAERLRNVEGAFAPTRRARALRGATVVLVDDVRTTGATLESCARVLKEAGVREVRVVTAARVALPFP